MSKSKSRIFFRTWHKRIGIVSSLFVLLLSVTGIFLNHTSDMHLGKSYVHIPWVLSLYGHKPPEYKHYSVSVSNKPLLITQIQKQIYLGENLFYQCQSNAIAVVVLHDIWAFVCEKDVAVFDGDGNVLDVVTASLGLPENITGAYRCGALLCVVANGEQLSLDLEQLQWHKNQASLQALPVSVLSPDLLEHLNVAFGGAFLSWERVILDLHAGRFLGAIGPWFMDVMALLFIVLALTGLYLWWQAGRKSSRKKARIKHKK